MGNAVVVDKRLDKTELILTVLNNQVHQFGFVGKPTKVLLAYALTGMVSGHDVSVVGL